MKKITAILLTLLILFNTLGFYGLLVGLRYKFAKDLVQRLDDDQYRREETITLKVPISIPYYMDDEQFQRVNGEIEHQGEFYRLVKQKLSKDTLYIVCIRDKKSKQIKKALADYVKTFTDKPVNANQPGKTTISFLKDYIPSSFDLSSESKGWNAPLLTTFIPHFFSSPILDISSPPPRA